VAGGRVALPFAVTPQPRHWLITENRATVVTAKTRSGGCLRSELTDGLPRSSLSAVVDTSHHAATTRRDGL